jgi:VanZ family protein
MEKMDCDENRKSRFVKIVNWLVVALWMALIFWFSAQDATLSDETSSGIVALCVACIQWGAAVIGRTGIFLDTTLVTFFVRKCAHACLYGVLGILTARAVAEERNPDIKTLALALGLCVLYALSDEGHQYFVPGRSAELRDVLVDSCGAFIGVLLTGIIRRCRRSRPPKLS